MIIASDIRRNIRTAAELSASHLITPVPPPGGVHPDGLTSGFIARHLPPLNVAALLGGYGRDDVQAWFASPTEAGEMPGFSREGVYPRYPGLD